MWLHHSLRLDVEFKLQHWVYGTRTVSPSFLTQEHQRIEKTTCLMMLHVCLDVRLIPAFQTRS